MHTADGQSVRLKQQLRSHPVDDSCMQPALPSCPLHLVPPAHLSHPQRAYYDATGVVKKGADEEFMDSFAGGGVCHFLRLGLRHRY
jgi:hypothetical protein